MVRLAIMSDLHLEFDRVSAHPCGIGLTRSAEAWADIVDMLASHPMTAPTPVYDDGHPLYGPDLTSLKNAGIDLVLAAGDIDVRAWSVPWLAAVARYVEAPVAFVAGNHEFYGAIYERAIDFLREQAAETAGLVTFLEKDILDLRVANQDVVVLGCTLWTDYQLYGAYRSAPAESACQSNISDHRTIRIDGGKRKWTTTDAKLVHMDSRDWLMRECSRVRTERPNATIIMMTHHAPGPGSLHPYYRDALDSSAYASDIRSMVVDAEPDFYVHGHVHWPSDYCIGDVPVVSNPRGYVHLTHEREATATWLPKVIDLETRGNKASP